MYLLTCLCVQPAARSMFMLAVLSCLHAEPGLQLWPALTTAVSAGTSKHKCHASLAVTSSAHALQLASMVLASSHHSLCDLAAVQVIREQKMAQQKRVWEDRVQRNLERAAAPAYYKQIHQYRC